MSLTIFFVLSLLITVGNFANSSDQTQTDDIAEVKIGDQVWMARNFDGVTFANGDSIPEVRSADEWEKAGKAGRPAWCYYQNDASIAKKYGRIYNWYAINDPRGISPKGWHVPTNDEWLTLENFLGVSEAGTRLKCNGAERKNADAKTTDEFCALLGGYRSKEGGFSGMDEFTYLSSYTPRDQKENDVWGRGIHHENTTIMRCGLYKEHGVYLRLIKG